MIKNIILYLLILLLSFIFSIYYYAWFSWFFFLIVLYIPLVSLLISLPFMISCAVKGFVLFSDKEIKIGENFKLGLGFLKKNHLLCPRLKIKLKAENKFANINKTFKLKCSGRFVAPEFFKLNKLSDYCGCVNLKVKSCRIYDFLGIFFIPAKVNKNIKTYVMPEPEKPKLMPDTDKITVLGYKPKIGGGFSDYYELRPYQSGDSTRNIYWKLSYKTDGPIVREPSQPITRQLGVKMTFCSDNAINNSIAARFLYVCSFIAEQGSACYATSNYSKNISQINNYEDALNYVRLSLFENLPYNTAYFENNNAIIYQIAGDCEEVLDI